MVGPDEAVVTSVGRLVVVLRGVLGRCYTTGWPIPDGHPPGFPVPGWAGGSRSATWSAVPPPSPVVQPPVTGKPGPGRILGLE
jgi:hypothetical protein